MIWDCRNKKIRYTGNSSRIGILNMIELGKHHQGLNYACMVITSIKGKDQPVKVANPARGQLNREIKLLTVPVRA